MRIGSLLVLAPVCLLATVNSASAQPSDYDDDNGNNQPAYNDDNGNGDDYVGADEGYEDAVPGEAVASVDVFYDKLSNDGYWVDDPDMGHVFIPDRENFVPYTDGHWTRTNLGFVWASDEPFAWATTHYGRWAYSQPYQRWAWTPDTTWGPSWVEWRESGDDFGWAPLAPEGIVRAGYSHPVESWHYTPGAHILDVNVRRYYEPRDRVTVIHRGGAPMRHYGRIGGNRVVVGPASARLRAHRVVVPRPVRADHRLVGRMTTVESRAAVQRARDNRTTWETRNRTRVESNVRIRESQRRVVAEPRRNYTRTDTRRTEPVRTNGGYNRTEPRRDNIRQGEPYPNRTEPRRTEPTRTEPRRDGGYQRTEPTRTEPRRDGGYQRTEPTRTEPRRDGGYNRTEPTRTEPTRTEPRRDGGYQRTEPTRTGGGYQRTEPTRTEPRRTEPTRTEPTRTGGYQRTEPTRTEPTHQRTEPTRTEPRRTEPTRSEPHRTEPTRTEPTRTNTSTGGEHKDERHGNGRH